MTQEFIDRWDFVRSETWEILSILDDEKLQFRPEGEKWQALYAQFSCCAKTQRVYAEALLKGALDFSYFSSLKLPNKESFASKKFIIDYFHEVEELWKGAIQEAKGKEIVWPEQTISVEQHIARLCEHERLHHGQIISYFTLASFDLPPNFKRNWAL